MRYLSVCSGIEAATQAWNPLGWTPVAFSEIEAFPSAVLAHHYPNVPNWGDMTKFQEWPDADVDVLCGGTPCQSFSVAGLRKGLADPRGNLMLTYLAIAARYRPDWLVWENVPGVLSSNGGRDFGTFLRGLGELGYGFAYRVLDAQHVRTRRFPFAVPQRRRRVFVVGYLGDWRRAAAVLFDRESLRGDPPPRREAGQRAAPTISARPTGGGGLGTDFDCDGGLICADVASTLDAHFHDKQRLENQHINAGAPLFVAHALRGEGFDASEGGTGRGTPLVPVAYRTAGDGGVYEEGDATAPLTTATDPNAQIVAIQERAISENPDAGPDGVGVRQDGAAYTLEARQVPQAVAFSVKDHDGDAMHGVSPTLRAGGFDKSHANGGVMPAVAYPAEKQDADANEADACSALSAMRNSDAAEAPAERRLGVSDPLQSPQVLRPGVHGGGLRCQTNEGQSGVDDRALAREESLSAGAMQRLREGGADGRSPQGRKLAQQRDGKLGSPLPLLPHQAAPWAVRRLTPREAERLQGFPDDFTRIPYRGKPADLCPDGPRYKALGNSWAVNVAEWVGERIAEVAAWENAA